MALATSDIKFYEAFRSGASNGLIDIENEITTDVAENVFPNVTVTEAEDGATTYRKFFIKNEHSTDTWANVAAWIAANTTSEDDEITLGVGTSSDKDGDSELAAMTSSSVITLSSSGSDTRTVTLVGEDVNGVRITENVVLTGTTPVNSTNQFSKLYNASISATSGDLTVTVKQGSTTLGTIGINKYSAITYYLASSKAAGFELGSIAAAATAAVWMKRVVTAGATPLDSNELTFQIEGEIG